MALRTMGFENLRVYQAAVRLDVEVQAIVAEIGSGHAHDVDQVLRAAGSIQFNIGEAWGVRSNGNKRNRLGIARGEADEVRAVLRRLVTKGAVTEKRIRRACELTSAIAKMLTAWINKLSGDL